MYRIAASGNPYKLPVGTITAEEYEDLIKEYQDYGYDDFDFQTLPSESRA